MVHQRLARIGRACGRESAAGRTERREPPLIEGDQSHKDPRHGVPPGASSFARAKSTCQLSRRYSAGSITDSRFGKISRSRPADSRGRLRRANSLNRRLERLRHTAPPSFLPTTTPTRVWSKPFRRQSKVNNGHDTRLPPLKTNRIAALLRRRCWERVERGETTDRRVRRSACAGPWPYGAPALCGRLCFSSFRETRACVSLPNSMAAASWRTCETSMLFNPSDDAAL